MKIGILTFHYGSNYGGVLQAYASQEVLRKLGHNPSIINYRPKDKIKQFLIIVRGCIIPFKTDTLRRLIFFLTHFRNSQRVFDNFCKNYLSQTKVCHSEVDLQSLSYDAYIVGSDQVWNYTQQKYSTYFLGWVQNTYSKKISYAACCGRNKIDPLYEDILRKQLLQFNSISVRSKESKYFINDLISKDVPTVCDPTMLHDFKEFITPLNEEYILTYILGEDIVGGNQSAINMIKEKYNNITVYSIIISDHVPRLCAWAEKKLIDVRPQEWVNLIANCKFLFTDSFHGCVFAMKFGKPVIAYYNGETSGRRFVDLKEQFAMKNIVNNLTQMKDVLSNSLELSYFYEDKILDYQRKSLEYLNNALS